jgi:hypothetical protein
VVKTLGNHVTLRAHWHGNVTDLSRAINPSSTSPCSRMLLAVRKVRPDTRETGVREKHQGCSRLH